MSGSEYDLQGNPRSMLTFCRCIDAYANAGLDIKKEVEVEGEAGGDTKS